MLSKKISQLHYITQDLKNFSHAELAEFACNGGADWVQLRVKNMNNDEWKKIALETQGVCKKYGAKFIVNDNVRLAKEINADGVHLGKHDMTPFEARKILGNDFIIGGTANTMEDVRWLMENGVDYIGLGPFRWTKTKEKLSSVLGLEGIRKIVKTQKFASLRIPIIAIGGIQLEDVNELMQTGIHGIAVSSSINLAENKIEMTKQFTSSLRGTKQSLNLISRLLHPL